EDERQAPHPRGTGRPGGRLGRDALSVEQSRRRSRVHENRPACPLPPGRCHRVGEVPHRRNPPLSLTIADPPAGSSALSDKEEGPRWPQKEAPGRRPGATTAASTSPPA